MCLYIYIYIFKKLQVAIEKTHSAVVQMRQKSSNLLMNDHYSPESVIEIENKVTKRWEKLVTCAEDRYKLIQASISFYKTAEQVCSVLESLDREYRRDEDWCHKETLTASGAEGESDIQPSESGERATSIGFVINKHQEQKESFLRACTLARRTAETFLKYSNRSQYNYNMKIDRNIYGPEAKVRSILENLMAQENTVLDNWTQKKKKLDQCQQYILFEESAKQALEWILETGEKYLQTHSSLGETREQTEQLLREHNDFKGSARSMREKVKLLILMADNLVEKVHSHASAIKEWVARVDQAYKNFSSRMDHYRCELQAKLGIAIGEERKGSLSLDRHSDPFLEQKVQTVVTATQFSEKDDVKRKSARKKELIMRELLQTERIYVKDLQVCLKTYMQEARKSSAPASLQGKEGTIFCNMEEILDFHKSIFLQELEKYESIPEDVGHCFVTWAPKFDIYVKYCKAQPESNRTLVSSAGAFFDDVSFLFIPIPNLVYKSFCVFVFLCLCRL